MRNIDRRRYKMLKRMRTFGAAHRQHFPEASTAHEALRVIDAELDQLDALDVAERSASQAARSAPKAAVRKSLVDCLRRADDTASVLAKRHPGFVADGKVPYPADDVQLLTIAREFVMKAAPLAAEFAAHGIPVAELDERVNALDRALNERGMQRDEKVRARARIDASLQRALDAVETLDVTVANHLGNDPVAMAVWKSDRRMWSPRRTRAGAKAAEEEPSPVTVEAEAPAVAAETVPTA